MRAITLIIVAALSLAQTLAGETVPRVPSAAEKAIISANTEFYDNVLDPLLEGLLFIDGGGTREWYFPTGTYDLRYWVEECPPEPAPGWMPIIVGNAVLDCLQEQPSAVCNGFYDMGFGGAYYDDESESWVPVYWKYDCFDEYDDPLPYYGTPSGVEILPSYPLACDEDCDEIDWEEWEVWVCAYDCYVDPQDVRWCYWDTEVDFYHYGLYSACGWPD